jgi:hypothetical protein
MKMQFLKKIVISSSLVLLSSSAMAGGAAFNTLPVCLSPYSATLYGTSASTGPQLSGQLFNYGETTVYGHTAQASCGSYVGGVALCSATLTGLKANTIYHYQFYGTFSGCGNRTCTEGSDMTFKTCSE